MPLIDVLGWIAAAIGMSSAMPQLIRLFRTRTSAGLSMMMWQLSVAAFAAWAVHGALVDAVQLQVPNLVLMLSGVAVMYLIARDRGQRLWVLLALPVGLFAGLVVIDVTIGAAVFGFFVALPLVGGQISQLRFMRSSAELTGLSLSYLAIAVLVQVVWLIWGVLVGERAIVVSATMLGLLCVTNLAYYLYRTLRPSDRDIVAERTDEMPPAGAEAVA